MFWERTSGGSEEGDGKNLHFQQAHVKAMRFLAAPTRSSTGPSWLRESMRQALTLVRQLQCDRVCFQEKRVIDAHWAVVDRGNAGFYASPMNRAEITVDWFSLHGKAAQGGTARSVQLLKWSRPSRAWAA